MHTKIIYLLFITLLSGLSPFYTHAEPAGFYYWQSKTSKHRVCLQYAPSKTWTKINGPYKDAGCRVRKRT